MKKEEFKINKPIDESEKAGRFFSENYTITRTEDEGGNIFWEGYSTEWKREEGEWYILTRGVDAFFSTPENPAPLSWYKEDKPEYEKLYEKGMLIRKQ